MKTELKVTGMHCASCKMLIEDVCQDIGNIVSCTVEVKTGRMVVEHTGKLDTARLKKEIEQLGKYKVTIPASR